MARSIDIIKAELALGGARPSLFEVSVIPTGVGESSTMVPKLTFLCKAATLPPSSQGIVEVPFQGRKIKVAGNRTYPIWDLTIINDEDFIVRNALESWHNAINLPRENIRGLGATSAPASYKGTAEINQLSKEGKIIRSYQFEGIWPSDVQAVQMDWGNVDTISDTNVSFAYDIWILGSNTPR